ncbi:T9SS type A sorting domain-containing protein [Flavobacterium sp.]|uniref:T9SS type A sorting domain-containing protein n=1 Tax=Flavobacterium sp. TaxID=239 RepID=UPI0038FC66D1
MKRLKLYIFITLLTIQSICCQTHQFNSPIVLAYFPSYSETWTSSNQNSKLREIPSYVNYVFLAFAKPDLTYVRNSFDITGTGIEVPYNGCTLKESVSALKAKGINVILSIGGETYWNTNVYSNINYQQIKDLVDDIGFIGIDWDFEPDGSFQQIGNTTNVQHFIDFFTNSRAVMPRNAGYVLACAPAGVGALGGVINNDVISPFSFQNRGVLTGETDANLYNGAVITNGINLYGFGSTGHMIPVLQAVGDKIDIIAYQGYNTGASTNRSIMYDSYAYYAEIYGFKVAAGVHYPNEPWGPYYTYTHQNIAELSSHIKNYSQRVNDNDGIMLWQLLMTGTGSSGYSYMNVASKVLNGISTSTAVTEANIYSLSPYTGGAIGCSSITNPTTYCGYSLYNPVQSYATANTNVFYNCKIWKNQWWANANEIPGENSVWTLVSNCNEGIGCTLNNSEFTFKNKLYVYIEPNDLVIKLDDNSIKIDGIEIYNIQGQKVLQRQESNKIYRLDKNSLPKGIYIIKGNIEGETYLLKSILY